MRRWTVCLVNSLIPMVYTPYMSARLILWEKHILRDGSIVEMLIWQLPRRSPERPHGIKSRLYHGSAEGRCFVRYDNELVKGDHRHYGGREASYRFLDVETLLQDFLNDVAKARRTTNEKEN